MKPSQPIPTFGQVTTYRGVTFRSKCEARWAAQFDLIGWDWDYEPRGEKTFPDFVVQCAGFDTPLYFEVKGAIVADNDIVAIGESPMPRIWVEHPDAIKARDRFADLMSAGEMPPGYDEGGRISIAVGDATGLVWRPASGIQKGEDLLVASNWTRRKFSAQSRYDWARTLIMVTGQGQH